MPPPESPMDQPGAASRCVARLVLDIPSNQTTCLRLRSIIGRPASFFFLFPVSDIPLQDIVFEPVRLILNHLHAHREYKPVKGYMDLSAPTLSLRLSMITSLGKAPNGWMGLEDVPPDILPYDPGPWTKGWTRLTHGLHYSSKPAGASILLETMRPGIQHTLSIMSALFRRSQ